VANYALFELAARHGVKVVIGGQGADEVLGGYRSYQWDYWHSLVADGRWRALTRDVRAFAKLHGGSSVAMLVNTLSRSMRIALSATRPYQRLRDLAGLAPPHTVTTRLFSPDLLALAGRPTLRPGDFRVAATQRHSLRYWPLPMYLRIEDRSSMAHSVEARLPFMDYRLVEHGVRMPDELKHAGGLNKVALRRAAAGRIPPSVLAQVDKFGFPVSAGTSTARRLHALCSDLAASREFRERGVFDLPAVERLLKSDRLEHPDHVDALFYLAQSEIWLRDMGPNERPASGRGA
jgi:asparagine synthase (glutamine-hydrolysing)